MNMDSINKNSVQSVYNYLTDNIKYAFFTDGFVVQIPNTYDMEVTVAYVNEEYYELNQQFDVSQGCRLSFDYPLLSNDIEIKKAAESTKTKEIRSLYSSNNSNPYLENDNKISIKFTKNILNKERISAFFLDFRVFLFISLIFVGNIK